jgi:uncharacterized protein (DUF924 family)
MTIDGSAEDLVAFWTAAGMQKWFGKDPAFDATLRDRFSKLHDEAREGDLAPWLESADRSFAGVLALDQFPRNVFRGTPRMFATDARARELADRAIALGHDKAVVADVRYFYYLPFEHAESLVDQERSVRLHEVLGLEAITKYAIEHRDIIQRFGRFPHRNAVLGRTSTAEEIAFLEGGGFAG